MKEQFSAFKNLPKFFGLIWETSKSMTIANIALRLLRSAIPLAMLYVGKLIIDEVVRLINIGGDSDMTYLWTIVGIELGLALFSDIINRGITLMDGLLGDLFSNKTSVELIRHSARLDLSQFEDPDFYDKLERARRQTVTRVVLMTQVLSQFQDIITVILLAGGLIYFNPWLIVILLIAVIPSFLGETHFNERSYSLSRGWTPERRELDYLRFIGASDETAKEVKIFGLSGFLAERFEKLAHKYYIANQKIGHQTSHLGNGIVCRWRCGILRSVCFYHHSDGKRRHLARRFDLFGWLIQADARHDADDNDPLFEYCRKCVVFARFV